MTPLFPISKVYRSSKWIIVHIVGQVPYHVNREQFESWLERTDRLEYLTDVYPNERGEPVGGETLTMTLREYWKLDNEIIERHLYEHIIYSQDNQYFDLRKSIDKVLDAAKAQRNANVHPTFDFVTMFNKAI